MTWPLPLCTICGRDEFALYHYDLSDAGIKAHDFEPEYVPPMDEPKVRLSDEEVLY